MGARLNIDADLANADWPKRTPDHIPTTKQNRSHSALAAAERRAQTAERSEERRTPVVPEE